MRTTSAILAAAFLLFGAAASIHPGANPPAGETSSSPAGTGSSSSRTVGPVPETGTASTSLAAPAAAVRPNIITIMADDLDEGSLATMLQTGLLPNIQAAFVSKGVRFANSFVNNAVCAPSRATYLTGQFSHNHGVRHNLDGMGGGVTALNHQHTLPVWMQNAGYRTGHVGKYINGYGTATEETWVPPGWDHWQGLLDPTTYEVYNYRINDNGAVVQYGATPAEYQTDVLAQRAVRFIDDSKRIDDAKPFFLTVTPLAPHVEVHELSGSDIWEWTIRPAPRHVGSTDSLPLPRPWSFNELDVRDKPLWLQQRPLLTPADVTALTRKYRDRLASIRAVDDLVGAIVSALARNGELDRTVLLFTADNGYLYGEHRMPEKLVVFEESIRVPLYVRLPGATAARTVTDAVVNTDLAPTIAELGGATPTHVVDGRSFVPALAGVSSPARKRLLVEHWMMVVKSTVPTYTAVRSLDSEPVAPRATYAEYREGEWGAKEYYEMFTDPFQLLSRHADPATSTRRAHLDWYLERFKWAAGAAARALEE